MMTQLRERPRSNMAWKKRQGDSHDVHELQVERLQIIQRQRSGGGEWKHKKKGTRGKRTHNKVDPKVERVRRVEGRASDEPFGAKRHPPVNARTRLRSICLPPPRGNGGIKYERTRRKARPC